MTILDQDRERRVTPANVGPGGRIVPVAIRSRRGWRSCVDSRLGLRGFAELSRDLELPRPTVSLHVAYVKDRGQVASRIEGRQVFNSLTRLELLDALATAQTLLAATGQGRHIAPRRGWAGKVRVSAC
ncbi:hypothetical protein BJF87_24165 [Gordonia sp. CNJ-863]|nr:hypothetical protein BJF87_24165 [Gordonia sp. CNJ-863]